MAQLGVAGFDRIRFALVPHGQVVARAVMQIEVHPKMVTVVLFGWRFVDHFLSCLSGAFIHDTPGEKTARGPVDYGYDVSPVFFRSMKVNNSSISATSTFPSGLGTFSGNWSENARAQLETEPWLMPNCLAIRRWLFPSKYIFIACCRVASS